MTFVEKIIEDYENLEPTYVEGSWKYSENLDYNIKKEVRVGYCSDCLKLADKNNHEIQSFYTDSGEVYNQISRCYNKNYLDRTIYCIEFLKDSDGRYILDKDGKSMQRTKVFQLAGHWLNCEEYKLALQTEQKFLSLNQQIRENYKLKGINPIIKCQN